MSERIGAQMNGADQQRQDGGTLEREGTKFIFTGGLAVDRDRSVEEAERVHLARG